MSSDEENAMTAWRRKLTSPHGPKEVWLADQAFPNRKPTTPIKLEITMHPNVTKIRMPDGTIYEHVGSVLERELKEVVDDWKAGPNNDA